MEPRKRKYSSVWDHFDLITPDKVKCRLCASELSYATRNTSSMLRHYRARHEREENTSGMGTASRKEALNRCIINMVIKDCQPLSIVEDEGFREMLQTLEPTYAIPSRKALKEMVTKRYEDEKGNVKEKLQSTSAVSLTADMWTSINMEAFHTCSYCPKSICVPLHHQCLVKGFSLKLEKLSQKREIA